MNPFSNPQLQVDDLPDFENIDFVPLQTSYRTANIITSILAWCIVSSVVGTTIWVEQKELPFPLWVPVAILLLLLMIQMVHVVMGFRHKRYAIRHHDIQLQSGWVWQSTAIIPFNRIQHSEVVQGPIDRLFNLAKLKVFTAGGSSSDLKIPGLDHQEATRLKHLITSRISASEEE